MGSVWFVTESSTRRGKLNSDQNVESQTVSICRCENSQSCVYDVTGDWAGPAAADLHYGKNPKVAIDTVEHYPKKITGGKTKRIVQTANCSKACVAHESSNNQTSTLPVRCDDQDIPSLKKLSSVQ